MDEVTVKITMSQKELPKVEFNGEWCRRDVDIAYHQMLKGLIHHNKKLREQKIEEANNE